MLQSLRDLDPARFDRPDILKAVAKAARSLAEPKGVAETIPNEGILLNTLSIQEAKDSSAIENIITTHDEVFRGERSEAAGPAAKEVENYRAALRVGFEDVLNSDLRVSRLTATNYLDALVDTGFLTKRCMGRSNFYINSPLFLILSSTTTNPLTWCNLWRPPWQADTDSHRQRDRHRDRIALVLRRQQFRLDLFGPAEAAVGARSGCVFRGAGITVAGHPR